MNDPEYCPVCGRQHLDHRPECPMGAGQEHIKPLEAQVARLRAALQRLIDATYPDSAKVLGQEMRHVSQRAVDRARAALAQDYRTSKETNQ